jgi:uncharacterized membrane protein
VDLGQWLLALHVTGAFLLFGGAVVAAVFNVLAHRRERPSEIALLYGLTRVAVYAIWVGALLTIVLGLWLVHHDGFGYGEFWVWASVLLWIAANALGGAGGKRQDETRALATRLAAEGDRPNPELNMLVRDARANALSWAAGGAILLILILMIWKPGS